MTKRHAFPGHNGTTPSHIGPENWGTSRLSPGYPCGGTASNVNQAGQWADRTLGETAEAASENPSAETAIKIVKQAGRLGEKY